MTHVELVGIAGAGLIGTSVGLALRRAGTDVVVADRDPARARAAAALGAGRAVDDLAGLAAAAHVVVAVPPPAVGAVVAALEGLNTRTTFSDVASTKANVHLDVETLTTAADRFCGGHPIAGRERGGPGAAQPELFDNAVWVVTPGPSTSPAAQADAAEVARRCGARVVELSPEEHDRVLAVVSHVPQLVASAVAASLVDAGPRGPLLAGTGFRDTTRLADGDPELWAAIVGANAGPVAAGLRAVADALLEAAAGLDAADVRAATRLVARGNAARRLLPGKRTAPRPAWARVGVVLADRPGELARVLGAAGAAGVNVEDLHIEHSPEHPVGFVDLSVRPEAVDTVLAALESAGWSAHRTG